MGKDLRAGEQVRHPVQVLLVAESRLLDDGAAPLVASIPPPLDEAARFGAIVDAQPAGVEFAVDPAMRVPRAEAMGAQRDRASRALALDLGGMHDPIEATLDFDKQASALGISPGNTYQMDIFHAERHTSGSNFRVETNIKCFTPVVVVN